MKAKENRKIIIAASCGENSNPELYFKAFTHCFDSADPKGKTF